MSLLRLFVVKINKQHFPFSVSKSSLSELSKIQNKKHATFQMKYLWMNFVTKIPNKSC